MMRMAITCAFVCAAACGPAHHSGDDAGLDIANAKLSIEPPMSELLIVNGAVASEGFTATLTFPDGTTQDVTSETAFGVSNGLGSFTGPQLSVNSAGKGTVLGTWQDKAGDAQVIARLKDVRVDPTLDPNTPNLFTGPEDPSRAPTILYPPVGVVMPRNLGDFETHWTDASGNDVFEVSLHTEFSDVRVYVPGGNGVAAAGPMPSWTAFLADEWLAAVGVETTVDFQVRGIQKANPVSVGSAAPQQVKLTNEAMEGGLYYWNSAPSGVHGIFRHDMSKPGQPAEEFMTTNQTAGRCVACHVLSRDGAKMAITYDGGNGAGTMVDVGTATAAPTVAGTAWNFGTFMPDGNSFIAISAGKFTVRDYATQAVIANLATTGWATHPDMSPDGSQLVYVSAGTPGADWHFGNGQIIVQAYDATNHALGAARTLVADASNNFYPSWSPDGQWILFNKSADNSSGGGAYNNPSASLWVIKADGTAPAIPLGTANLVAGGLTNSWGRWAPFQQTLGTNHDPLYWITVSSKRDFGVRKRLTDNWPQIWMFAFSPALAGAGADPGAPAFRLPFQDLAGTNHIAQWAEKVVVTQ